jgi:CheY-like chemotaxis protein
MTSTVGEPRAAGYRARTRFVSGTTPIGARVPPKGDGLRANREARIVRAWRCVIRVLPDDRPAARPGLAPWPVAGARVTIGPMPWTVVIVDDHARFRRSARKLLELEGFAVIGEAADGASGVEVVERLRPDVVLLDVALPDTSGLALVPALSVISDVVLVSSRDPGDVAGTVRRSEALAFIPKDQLTGEAVATALEARR